MSTAKFEKLIDLIINEDQERAEQLFHEIVVEKSREIYESLMDDDLEEDMSTGLMDEIESEEMNDTTMEETGEDEEISGDFDVETDDDMGDDMDDMGDDMGDMDDMGDADMGSEEPATKDDIMDLEDKLDQLLAAFEEEFGAGEEGGEEEFEGGEEEESGEEEEGEEEDGLMEAVELKKVAAPKHGDDGSNKNSPVAANAGGKGPMGSVVKPVKFSGATETPPTSPKAPASNAYGTKSEKDIKGAGSYQNSPNGAKGVKSGSGVAAAKPELKQASGVNTKDIVPESRVSKKKMVK